MLECPAAVATKNRHPKRATSAFWACFLLKIHLSVLITGCSSFCSNERQAAAIGHKSAPSNNERTKRRGGRSMRAAGTCLANGSCGPFKLQKKLRQTLSCRCKNGDGIRISCRLYFFFCF